MLGYKILGYLEEFLVRFPGMLKMNKPQRIYRFV